MDPLKLSLSVTPIRVLWYAHIKAMRIMGPASPNTPSVMYGNRVMALQREHAVRPGVCVWAK